MSEEKKDGILGQEKELDLDELDSVAGGGRLLHVPVRRRRNSG